MQLHHKKSFSIFPSPSGMSSTKLSLFGKYDVIYKLFLPRESLVSDIPAGDGKIEKLFLRCAMAWDIIFFSLAGPVGDYTGAHTVIFRLHGCDFYYLPEDQRSCDKRGGGRWTLFFTASVVERL
jgi:hypothetical protein